MELRAILEALPGLEDDELQRLDRALHQRMEAQTGRPASEVVEYRPYSDGVLQSEIRYYTRRDGSRRPRGPYWYFRYHEGGKQKKLYLGKTDDPEGVLVEKRGG